jgi:hypothetical protein
MPWLPAVFAFCSVGLIGFGLERLLAKGNYLNGPVKFFFAILFTFFFFFFLLV